jgi:hypothetical protein
MVARAEQPAMEERRAPEARAGPEAPRARQAPRAVVAASATPSTPRSAERTARRTGTRARRPAPASRWRTRVPAPTRERMGHPRLALAARTPTVSFRPTRVAAASAWRRPIRSRPDWRAASCARPFKPPVRASTTSARTRRPAWPRARRPPSPCQRARLARMDPSPGSIRVRARVSSARPSTPARTVPRARRRESPAWPARTAT